MITTVLFDLGNVILPFDVTRLANRLVRHCDFSAEEIAKELWNDRIAHHFETGRMTPEEFFTDVSKQCGFRDLSFDEFVPIFNEIFDEDNDIADLISRLKKNYKLGLISNTNAIHVAYITKKYPTLTHFDRLWWSNETGMRKPDPSLYRLALEHFDVAPEKVVFIDDLPVNIDAARQLGINGIVYEGAGALKTELSKLGVKY